MPNDLFGKSILDLTELTKTDIMGIIELGIALKKAPEDYQHVLSGKILGMIFEKASTRTRVSFEAGMLQLGGHAIVLSSSDTQIGRGEPIADTAKVLSGYLDGIMIRTFQDEMVKELASEGSIPVINGLTDDHHPCQVLADLMTIYELKGKVEGLQLVYIGDGNNMAHSLMIGGALVGLNVTIASPVGYEVKAEYLKLAQSLAVASGAVIKATTDPQTAIIGADIVYTDVWSSMGFEKEQQDRVKAFAKDFQVNEALVGKAHEDYLFLHCLPAHRGEEVTAAIIDGAHSVVFQEAENRLHAQKALLIKLLTP